MKLSLKILILLFIFLDGIASASPSLNFSDITSGPKTGIGDSLGSGVIVTVWGNNLGSKQGASKIYCNGAEASHIYYWGNADGSSGPSNLYAYHKMQEISFSVGPGATDGDGIIYVTVGSEQSNTLPFTVRSGNIYHVKTTGNDNTGNGTWSNPWATISLNSSGTGKWASLSAGDTVYLHDGLQEIDHYNDGTRLSGMKFSGTSGIEKKPISVIAYPRAKVLARGKMYGIYVWVPYVNISKIRVEGGNNSDGSTTGRSSGISPGRYARLIGNYITDREGSAGPAGCADGGNGAITANAANGDDRVSGLEILGNTIADWGCAGTHKFEHTTYISNRSGGTGTPVDIEAWEYGWNFLKDNMARGGLHAYDENLQDSEPCGDITGTVKIHNNVIMNQLGAGIYFGTNISTTATLDCWSAPVEIYNNLLINTGIGADGPDFQTDKVAIGLAGRGTTSNVKIYNNTIYGTGDSLSSTGIDGVIYLPDSTKWNGTVEWYNNIVYDTKKTNYTSIGSGSESTITAKGNNLWFSSAGGLTVPTWDIKPITIDPNFRSADKMDFCPMVPSPVINAGNKLIMPTIPTDLLGTNRLNNDELDIGAIEFTKQQPIIIDMK